MVVIVTGLSVPFDDLVLYFFVVLDIFLLIVLVHITDGQQSVAALVIFKCCPGFTLMFNFSLFVFSDDPGSLV